MPGPIHTILPRPRRRVSPRRFMPRWPSVGARQDEAFRNIWQALRQHDHIQATPLDIEARSQRADHFVVCAIRLPLDDATLEALEPLRAELARYPFIRLAPLESLAITIQELGLLVDEPELTDEVSRERIAELIRHASTSVCDFPRFEVRVGGVNSFVDAPFLDVHDDGWCYRIHHRLRDFTLLPVDDTFAYLPHMPLGIYTRDAELRDLPAHMARWRDRTFATFHAPAVELLAIPTADPLAPPTVLHRFELGRSLGAADTITQAQPSEIF